MTLEVLNFELNQLPHVEFSKKDRLPETAGIYFVVDKNQKIWYIGQAQNLRSRWVGHHRTNQIKKINAKSEVKLFWYCCEKDEDTLTQLENYFINKYYPILNQTKVEAKEITPSEIELRNTLVKISKYIVIIGFEENSQEFGLPTVYLKYDWSYRNPAKILKNIFDAVNRRGNLRWSYYWKSKSTPIWKTKCNGVAIVVSGDPQINEFVKTSEGTILDGIAILKISDANFQKYIAEKDWSQSYHPYICKYTLDPIPLIWSKNLEIDQYNIKTLKELSQERIERKSRAYKPRGKRVKVVCNVLNYNIQCVVEVYEEAINWFGGYEALGLERTYRSSFSLKGWKPAKVYVRIQEVEGGVKKYRSISAPISASDKDELIQRYEKIKHISPLHQKVKLKI